MGEYADDAIERDYNDYLDRKYPNPDDIEESDQEDDDADAIEDDGFDFGF